MPVTTGPACLTSLICPIIPMPVTVAGCTPETSAGGVNDLYFIPCPETMSETSILDIVWWTNLKTTGILGNIGIGLGSIGKKSVKTEKIGSCRGESIVSTTWALKYTIKTIDKTSADITTEQINALIKRFTNFQAIARMCDGPDRVLPIGIFSVSDFDWIVPENSEDVQSVSFELSWIELGKPKSYIVAGLSAVIPKA